MILASLPYPPIPLLATRLESDDHRLQDDALTTSHTLIARCLNECVSRGDAEANRQRRRRQTEVFQRFLHAMATHGFFAAPEQLHQLLCDFTALYIGTYFPVGHPLDLRFAPFSSVCRGDKAHAKMSEFMAGQSIVFEDDPPLTREHFLRLDYGQQLLAYRDRFGHAMTSEERAALDADE